MSKKTSESNCSRISEGGCAAMSLGSRIRGLAHKGIAAFMAVVMAVGLMPLPAYAAGSTYYVADAALSSRPLTPEADSVSSIIVRVANRIAAQSASPLMGDAYAVYDSGTLVFVRSVAGCDTTATLSDDNMLISTSGTIYRSGSVFSGFENSSDYMSGTDTWRSQSANVEHIVFADEIAPQSCEGWFKGFSKVSDVANPENLDTANVEQANEMFSGCSMLGSLDLSNWDVSKVKDARSMFAGCTELASLNLHGWKLSAVLMGSMFQGCKMLSYIDLSGFDMSQSTNMTGMFTNCQALTAVRLGSKFSFYASNSSNAPACGIGDLDSKWYHVSGTPSDLSGSKDGLFAKTYAGSNTNMVGVWKKGTCENGAAYAVFDSTSGTLSFKRLASEPVGVEHFEVKESGLAYAESGNNAAPWRALGDRVKRVAFDEAFRPVNVNYWFAGMTNLVSADLNALDTVETTSMAGMFKNCVSLTSIDGIDCLDTSNVTSMEGLFSGCSSLSALDLSSFSTAKATASMADMFKGCASLVKVTFGSSFRFGSNCTLPTPSGEGLSGKWAKGSSVVSSQSQKSPEEMADAQFATQLAGTWVPARDLRYIVKFRDGDTVETRAHSVSIAYELPTASMLGIIAKDDFDTFEGWVASGTGSEDLVSSIAANEATAGDVIVFDAVWSRNITVHFGKSPSDTTSIQQYRNGSTYSAQVPTSAFADSISPTGGWAPYALTEGQVMPDDQNSMLKVEKGASYVTYTGTAKDLYAVYSRSLSFTYDANAGNDPVLNALPSDDSALQFYVASSLQPEKVTFTEIPTLIECYLTRAGYEFAGWSGDKAATSNVTSLTVQPGIDASGSDLKTTLFAVWAPHQYTVRFDSNGGDNTMTPQSRSFGDGEALPGCKFQKRGYEFAGWEKQGDSSKRYDDEFKGDLTDEEGDEVTLVAQWNVIEYTVTLDYAHGTLEGANGWTVDSEAHRATRKYTVEDTVDFPKSVKDDEYQFTNWQDEGEILCNAIEKGTIGDLTFYAKWLEYVDAPNRENGLTYTSRALVGVCASPDEAYVLTPGEGATLDLSGNAVATKVGSYSIKVSLQAGYAWKDGTTTDKEVVFEIAPAAIAKIVIASVTEEDAGSPSVQVYVKDPVSNELIALDSEATEQDLDVTVEYGIDGTPIAKVSAKQGGGLDGAAKVDALYEVTDNPEGRRTETAIVDGLTVSRVFDATSEGDSLEKLTAVSAPDENGVVTTTEYVGSGMSDDGKGKVVEGAQTVSVVKAKYEDGSLVGKDETVYKAKSGEDLDTKDAIPSGAAEVTKRSTTYNDGKVANEIEAIYKAADDQLLGMSEDGAVTSAASFIESRADYSDGELTEKSTVKYEAPAEGSLNLTGDVPSGAAKLKTEKTTVDENKIETTTVDEYEAPSGKTLDISGNVADGLGVADASVETETSVTRVKRPGEEPDTIVTDFSSTKRSFADDDDGGGGDGGLVVATEATKSYTGNAETGLAVENGVVTGGASRFVERRVTNDESGSTTVTTTRDAFDGGSLGLTDSPISGVSSEQRLTVERNGAGEATRVEDVTTTYNPDGSQKASTTSVYTSTAENAIPLKEDGTVDAEEAKKLGLEPEIIESETKYVNGVPVTTATVTELDASGNPVSSQVETKIAKLAEENVPEGCSAAYEITTTSQALDANGNPTGDKESESLKVAESKPDASGAVTTTMTIGEGENAVETEMKVGKDGLVEYVRNGDVQLEGDSLNAIRANSEWIWLDANRDSTQIMRKSSDIKAEYEGKTYDMGDSSSYASETPVVFSLKLSLLSPVTGMKSVRNSGLSDLTASFLLKGDSSYNGRKVHATHVYSESQFDVNTLEDSAVKDGRVSYRVTKLNEFVIAVEKQVFTVEYDSASGTAVDSVKVADGTVLAAPALPTRNGYVFDTWYDDATLKVTHDFAVPVTSDVKLHAKWKGNLSTATVTLTAKTKSLAYNTKKRVPTISSVKLKDGTVVPKTDYKVSYLKYASKKKTAIAASKVTAVATYYVKLTPQDENSYTGANDKASFKIVASNNPFTVKAKAKTFSVKAKSGKSFKKAANAFKITNKSKAKLTYSKLTVTKGKANVTKKADGKKITVSKTGVVKVLKGIAAGTYKVKVKVLAAKKGGYKQTTRNVVLTIKVS